MTQEHDELKLALKKMIVVECDTDWLPEDIPDDIALIGDGLGLDSLDALEICVAVHRKYGVRIEAGPDVRKALRSIHALADTILEMQAKSSE